MRPTHYRVLASLNHPNIAAIHGVELVGLLLLLMYFQGSDFSLNSSYVQPHVSNR